MTCDDTQCLPPTKKTFQCIFEINSNSLDETILKLLFFFAAILFTLISIAQEIKPVQFTFKATRNQQGKALLLIKANVSDGVQLLSIKKKTPDDAFISTITFDSICK